jgi:hypothetical protein
MLSITEVKGTMISINGSPFLFSLTGHEFLKVPFWKEEVPFWKLL